jgi:hypothetical protein
LSIRDVGSARHPGVDGPGETGHVPLEVLGDTPQDAPDVLPVAAVGLGAKELT